MVHPNEPNEIVLRRQYATGALCLLWSLMAGCGDSDNDANANADQAAAGDAAAAGGEAGASNTTDAPDANGSDSSLATTDAGEAGNGEAQSSAADANVPDGSDESSSATDASDTDESTDASGSTDPLASADGGAPETLALQLEGYWETSSFIGDCGDWVRYERFTAPNTFTQLTYSDGGCLVSSDGNTESVGNYQLSGHQLTVTNEAGLTEMRIIAIHDTATGLRLHPKIYVQQSELSWLATEWQEARDDAGEVTGTFSTSFEVEFNSELPLGEGAACEATVSFQIEQSGASEEAQNGSFSDTLGPYACTHEQTELGQRIELPLVTAEDLEAFEAPIQGSVRQRWPTSLTLPQPDADHLLPTPGYRKIAEADVWRGPPE